MNRMKKLMLAAAAATGLLTASILAVDSANTAAAQDGSEFRVNVATDGDQALPAITRLSDGGFVVAWQSDVPSGLDSDVYGRRYSAAVAPVSDEFRIPKK
jgi:ABC-type amino acid transport substrate-binding protein